METILHVDMDAFFASVERLRRPDLAGRPIVVGGMGPRGVVSSASYEARACGVHSAMPTVRARRICPEAAFLPPDFSEYRRYSRHMMDIFHAVTPLVEELSLDEAFLDVSGATGIFGPPEQIGAYIRARITDETGLTASVGVAANKFLAKMASTRAKPDGLLVIREERGEAYLRPLPVEDLWGVGWATAKALHRLGLKTVGDVARAPRSTLARALGSALGGELHELSHGRDSRPVVVREPARSVGAEETFEVDVDDPEVLCREVLRVSDRVASRLRESGYSARTVTLKVRFASFETVTRSRTLAAPTNVGPEIFAVARELLDGLRLERVRVRLVGVSATSLATGTFVRQLTLDRGRPRWEAAAAAVDRARARFGHDALRPAALIEPEPTPAYVEGREERRPKQQGGTAAAPASGLGSQAAPGKPR
ncbi:MAG: DNA polymerase IV [Actinomycetota bacterium]